jgi:Na+-driven multidrug efflux pump
MRRATLYLTPVMLIVGVAGTLLFPTVANVLTHDDEFAKGWPFFAIILAGLTLAAGRLPFSVALNQWGLPRAFFALALWQLTTNTVLNFAFVPFLGGHGSAIGTALSFVLTAAFLQVLLGRIKKE